MKKMLSAFFHCACAAVAMSSPMATAAATYDYSEENGKALVVTVGSGYTDYLSDDAVAHLNANDVTNLYKRGDGRLVITNNTSSYTGHFWIQDGILTSKPITGVSLSGNDNLTMGKVPTSGEDVAGCGAIHVCDGASFTVDFRGVSAGVAENLRLNNKTTYFDGAGFDGKGALTVLSGENNGAGPLGNHFGGYLRMTGDATIRNGINNWMGFSNQRYLDMGGHTLTLEGASVGVYENLWSASNFGDVVVKTPGLYCNRSMWFGSSASDSNHTMRVKSDAFLRLNGCVNAAYGTLHLEDGAYINLTDSDRTVVMGPDSMTDLNMPSSEYGDTRSKHNWMGPVVLDTPGRIQVLQSDSANGRYLQIGGKISGGGIALAPGVRLILRKHVGAPGNFSEDAYANDFTNGIFAAAGCDVTLMWGNLLPQGGGDLVLSNASFTVQNLLTYKLPHVKSYGTCKFLGKMDNAWAPGSIWDSVAGGDLARETRQYYHSLEFVPDDAGNCGGLFSTNVVVSNLSGLPSISAYPSSAGENPVRPCLTTSTGPEYFTVVSNWNIKASAVVAGGRLSFPDGELRLGHRSDKALVNVNCDVPDADEAAEYKIAEADSIVLNGGFNPRSDVTFTGSDRWRFKVGDDGKSLYLVYRPKRGVILLFK